MTTKTHLIAAMKDRLMPVAARVLGRSGQEILPLLEASIGVAMVRQGLKSDPAALPYVEQEKLDHIADWLSASVARDMPWLRKVSEDGIPRKFSKFHKVADVLTEADAQLAQMARTAMRDADGGDGVKIDVRFEDGWHIAELTSKNALIDEGNAMQHCVGAGSYDSGVRDGTTRIFSFRDRKGQPHVTMEYSVEENKLVQIKGKQNDFPLGRYFDRLVPWIAQKGFTVYEHELSGGYFVTRDYPTRIRHVRGLREGEKIEGALIVRLGGDFAGPLRLPAGLEVSEEMRVETQEGSEPTTVLIGAGVRARWAVFRNVESHGIENIGTRDLQVYGGRIVPGNEPKSFLSASFINCDIGNLLETASFEELKLCGARTVKIAGDGRFAGHVRLWEVNEVVVEDGGKGPEKLVVEGNIRDRDQTTVVIQSGVSMGKLAVSQAVVRIGENAIFNRWLSLDCAKLVEPPTRLSAAHLGLKQVSGLPVLPATWKIAGTIGISAGDTTSLGERNEYWNLNLSDSSIISLPENLVVGGNLDIERSRITSLPDRTIIGGDLLAHASRLENLGDGTRIGGSIELGRTPVASLPPGLLIKGDLTLDDNQRLRIQGDVAVTGKLTVRCMDAAHCIDRIEANSYDLHSAKISDFGGRTHIRGDLEIASDALAVLPDGLSVSGNLVVRGVFLPDQQMPDNLEVAGNIKFEWDFDGELPTGWRAVGTVVAGGTVLRTGTLGAATEEAWTRLAAY
ncbi:hypothetical protein HFN89_06160 [Rhizobium laguerreae]|nr:hypothetical protein [Rhizobium laguerreae]